MDKFSQLVYNKFEEGSDEPTSKEKNVGRTMVLPKEWMLKLKMKGH
jgi:hypothetical protein